MNRTTGHEREISCALEQWLAAADLVEDRNISTFANIEEQHLSGFTAFLRFPYLEDIREVGNHKVAALGPPKDGWDTYRTGSRLGPQAIRRNSSQLYTSSSYHWGVYLKESLDAAELGDVFLLPANIEECFDQLAGAVGHRVGAGVFPVILGGCRWSRSP